ncbi:MAG: 2-hydroxychromene-2-carboxylate isomerase [Gammaproteobacteria bacterium]
MSDPIDFYFDFSSPYGYLASHEIDALAAKHGRSVSWRPYLMGVAMKQSGAKPLTERPLIDAYAARDFARSARKLAIPFVMPDTFPVGPVAACRAYYWLHDVDADKAKGLARGLYAAYFAHNRNIADAEVVLECAGAAGADRKALAEGMQSQPVKDRLRAETEAAIARGVFGSPFFIIDDEPFWGHDRLPQVDAWLQSGGW